MDTGKRNQLIAKYLAGQANPDEIKLLEAWFYAFDDTQVEVKSATPLDKEEVKQALFKKIKEKIKISEPVESQYQETKIIHWQPVWRWAASVLLLLSVGLGIRQFVSQPKTIAYQTISTANAKQNQFTLADGSVIYLNAGSSFRFPKQFSGSTREVYLTGEAFFKVAKNPEKPFIIHTGNLQTQVLGTSFNVQAYPNDSLIAVTVVSGKVSVSDSLASLTLQPGGQALYRTHTRKLMGGSVQDAAEYQAWTSGKLVFDSKNMAEISAVLERHYDVEISFRNEKIKHCRISSRFENEPIEKVLNLLCSYIGATYKKEGKKITIRGEGCR
ncbi:MAG: FecR domain-containing protein [Verrucomicrobia bacterium]|nr:FecR domain-containing protein [Cytophagales bacterium]